MRRSILLAAALGTTLTLTACSGGGSGADSTTGSEDTTGALTVWVDETRKAAVTDAAEAFEAETGEIRLLSPDGDDRTTTTSHDASACGNFHATHCTSR